MDNFFRPQGSDTQHPGGISAGLQIFKSILNWFIGLIKLTEEEQKDAGVYFKDGHNN